MKHLSVGILLLAIASGVSAELAAGHAQRLCKEAALVLESDLEGGIKQEFSGIAASRQYPDVYWTHRDSGNEAQLLAYNGEGQLLNSFLVTGAENRDWEDIAIAGNRDRGYSIYLADIGDNKRRWPFITLYRFAEPEVPGDGTQINIGDVQISHFRYPDKTRNAESLFIDERAGRFYVLSKETVKRFFWPRPAGPSVLYSGALNAVGEEAVALVFEREVDFVNLASQGHTRFRDEVGSRPVAEATTAADMHAGTGLIGVRTYGSLWLWQAGAGESVAEAMARPPCEAPTSIEIGGEGFAFSPDGQGYVTVAEYFSRLVRFRVE